MEEPPEGFVIQGLTQELGGDYIVAILRFERPPSLDLEQQGADTLLGASVGKSGGNFSLDDGCAVDDLDDPRIIRGDLLIFRANLLEAIALGQIDHGFHHPRSAMDA